EALARCGGLDSRLDFLLDQAEKDLPLESARIATIFAENGKIPPSPEEYAGLRFRFLQAETEPERAREDLAKAVGLLTERPALDAALQAATRRFECELSDDAWQEQQRLLKRKLEFDARLRQM